tara:strand:+ start:3557 stop:4213 length:657 start_codon:yes stop_codon:yes gene_type:complete
MKIAIIFGSTGLVGNHLLNLLLKNEYYSKIKLFTRTNIESNDSRIEIINIDFNNLNLYADKILGDDLFFCIGTTKKQTPNKNEYRRVEYTIPSQIAKIAKENNIKSFIYVSSLGSNHLSKNTYLKNKGEVEEIMKKLNFPYLHIIRPSFLLGPRKEFRLGEVIGQNIFKYLSFLFLGSLKKFRAIEVNVVAKSMMLITKNKSDKVYYDSNDLKDISDK